MYFESPSSLLTPGCPYRHLRPTRSTNQDLNRFTAGIVWIHGMSAVTGCCFTPGSAGCLSILPTLRDPSLAVCRIESSVAPVGNVRHRTRSLVAGPYDIGQPRSSVPAGCI